jgi:hypothetical protein
MFTVNIIKCARDDSTAVTEAQLAANVQNCKDDIAWLLHLYKDPGTQIHWSNLYGILSRAELYGYRSSGEQSEATNPWNHSTERFNDYDDFVPQNLMVEYVQAGCKERRNREN